MCKFMSREVILLMSGYDYDVLKALSKHFVNPPYSPVSIDTIMADLKTDNREAVKKSMIVLKSRGYIKAIIDQDDLGKMKLCVCTAITPSGSDLISNN